MIPVGLFSSGPFTCVHCLTCTVHLLQFVFDSQQATVCFNQCLYTKLIFFVFCGCLPSVYCKFKGFSFWYSLCLFLFFLFHFFSFFYLFLFSPPCVCILPLGVGLYSDFASVEYIHYLFLTEAEFDQKRQLHPLLIVLEIKLQNQMFVLKQKISLYNS